MEVEILKRMSPFHHQHARDQTQNLALQSNNQAFARELPGSWQVSRTCFRIIVLSMSGRIIGSSKRFQQLISVGPRVVHILICMLVSDRICPHFLRLLRCGLIVVSRGSWVRPAGCSPGPFLFMVETVPVSLGTDNLHLTSTGLSEIRATWVLPTIHGLEIPMIINTWTGE